MWSVVRLYFSKNGSSIWNYVRLFSLNSFLCSICNRNVDIKNPSVVRPHTVSVFLTFTHIEMERNVREEGCLLCHFYVLASCCFLKLKPIVCGELPGWCLSKPANLQEKPVFRISRPLLFGKSTTWILRRYLPSHFSSLKHGCVLSLYFHNDISISILCLSLYLVRVHFGCHHYKLFYRTSVIIPVTKRNWVRWKCGDFSVEVKNINYAYWNNVFVSLSSCLLCWTITLKACTFTSGYRSSPRPRTNCER